MPFKDFLRRFLSERSPPEADKLRSRLRRTEAEDNPEPYGSGPRRGLEILDDITASQEEGVTGSSAQADHRH